MKLVDAINSGKYNTIAKRETVTDLIPMSEVEKWNKGDYITIAAPTGRGKSHFIKHSLLAHAKTKNEKILLLQPRTLTKEQFQSEIQDDNILITSYQHFEVNVINNSIDLNEFDYIVVDEFHYFLNDASFNKYTDISLNKILELTNKKVIFMSATGDMMKKFIQKISNVQINHEYLINQDFSFINQVVFYKSDDAMIRQAANISKNNMKAIFFFDSAKKAYEMHERFKENSMFVCSKHNKHYASKMNTELLNSMLENQKFECNILFTTTALDTGLNIIDLDLNFLLLDVADTNSVIQCIGRKRNPKKLNLMIKDQSVSKLSGHKGRLIKEMNKAKYLKAHGQEDYLIKYYREYAELVYQDYDGKSKVNMVRYVNYLNRTVEIEMIIGRLEKEKYSHHLIELLNLKKMQYAIIETKQNEVDALLSEWENHEFLTKEDRIPLINALNIKANGRTLKTASTLNSALEELKSCFRIIEKKTNTNRKWIVKKV